MMPLSSTLPRIQARRARTLSFHMRLLPLLLLTACDLLPIVEVSVPNPSSTSERGTSVDVVVRPKERPDEPIEVFGESSNRDEGTVTGSLHFDANNWQTPQTLRITGVDDDREDGDKAYVINVLARQPGSHGGHRWLLQRIKLVNRDDDSASFEPIADLAGGGVSVVVAAASSDGAWVVGQSEGAAGVQAFRWSAGPSSPLGPVASSALAVSADGTQVVGSLADPSYESGRAAAAFALDGSARELSAPPQPGPMTGLLLWFVSATAVTNDGTVYGTCHQYAAYGEPLGCRLEDGVLTLVGGSFVYAADALGHYAGTQNAARHAPFSSRPFFEGTTLALPSELACPANVACTAEVRAFSESATVLVGTASLPLANAALGSPLYARAFFYTATDGVTLLPDLDGGELAAGAFAVSGDGRLIAGFGSDTRGQQAVLWLDREPRALVDVALELNVDLPQGWSLRELRAVSHDGRVLIGNGINPDGDPQGFRITLPFAP
jgi:hypothetical protein